MITAPFRQARKSQSCELSQKHSIQVLRRRQVMPERLLDDDSGICGTALMFKLFEHGFEHSGRDGEVVGGPLRRTERGA